MFEWLHGAASPASRGAAAGWVALSLQLRGFLSAQSALNINCARGK